VLVHFGGLRNYLKTIVTAFEKHRNRNLRKPIVWPIVRFMISPAQSRAARGLLDWTQQQLAEAVGLTALSIRSFEKGGNVRPANLSRIRDAFEAAGVIFVEENGQGAGVRLRKGMEQ
jgi:hypothetical protein